jgi:hypothetical protein
MSIMSTAKKKSFAEITGWDKAIRDAKAKIKSLKFSILRCSSARKPVVSLGQKRIRNQANGHEIEIFA